MRLLQKSSKATFPGLLSQLSQAKLLFRESNTQSNEGELTPIKQILLNKITPFIDKQTMIPGLSMGLRTVLVQVSDDDILLFLDEIDAIVGSCIEEISQAMVSTKVSTADLDVKDKLCTSK